MRRWHECGGGMKAKALFMNLYLNSSIGWRQKEIGSDSWRGINLLDVRPEYAFGFCFCCPRFFFSHTAYNLYVARAN